MLTLAQVREQETFEVVVDDYGFTGEGFVRLADGWLSIRGALPGERVRVSLEPNQREGARRLFARVRKVITPAEQRRTPLCERADVCHGCQLRHMTMYEEMRWKSASMVEILARYANLPPEAQPPMRLICVSGLWRGDAERIRSNMSYRQTDGGFEFGLRSPKVNHLISMAQCPALVEPLLRLIRVFEQCVTTLFAQDIHIPDESNEVGLRRVRIASPLHGRGMIVLEVTGFDDGLDGQSWQSQESLAWLVHLQSLLLTQLPERITIYLELDALIHLSGPRRMRLPVAGHSLEVGADDWFHATLRPAEVLYESILPMFAFNDTDRLLDLGCGVGTISVMSAQYVAQVVGLDVNRHSVETAQLNAFEGNHANVQIVAGNWENGMRRLMMDGHQFDVASINPMREPLGERALAYLVMLGIRRLVYLGPSPVAAARDFDYLLRQGWRLLDVGHAMLHPATIIRCWLGVL